MCIICVDINKGTLLPAEALRNLVEMGDSLDPEHYEEVHNLITESMIPEDNTSTEDFESWDEVDESLNRLYRDYLMFL